MPTPQTYRRIFEDNADGVADGLGVPKSIVPDTKKVQALREARKEDQQQQQQAMQQQAAQQSMTDAMATRMANAA